MNTALVIIGLSMLIFLVVFYLKRDKEKSARDIFKQGRTTFAKDQMFLRGVHIGAEDWILFAKENCKGMIGHHFAQEIDMLKKDLE